MALSLREGRARLVLRGRRRRDLALAARLDDGLWHTVSCYDKTVLHYEDLFLNSKNTSIHWYSNNSLLSLILLK